MTEATPRHYLSAPTLGENIGAAARAMMNFGLSEMRLVELKGDWPNQKAINTASGAERILEEAKIHHHGAAVADLQRLYATTARVRDMEKPVLAPRALADTLHGNSAKGEKSGILFGREAKGLHNDDVAISDAIMVPVNSEHRSINLAQAVLLIGYEWFQQTAPETLDEVTRKGGQAASLDELWVFSSIWNRNSTIAVSCFRRKNARGWCEISAISSPVRVSATRRLRRSAASWRGYHDHVIEAVNTRIGHFAFLLTWRARCIYPPPLPGMWMVPQTGSFPPPAWSGTGLPGQIERTKETAPCLNACARSTR